MSQAATKEEFKQAYQWHIQAFDYLLFNSATVLTDKERNDIVKAQQLLDNTLNITADRLYNDN